MGTLPTLSLAAAAACRGPSNCIYLHNVTLVVPEQDMQALLAATVRSVQATASPGGGNSTTTQSAPPPPPPAAAASASSPPPAPSAASPLAPFLLDWELSSGKAASSRSISFSHFVGMGLSATELRVVVGGGSEGDPGDKGAEKGSGSSKRAMRIGVGVGVGVGVSVIVAAFVVLRCLLFRRQCALRKACGGGEGAKE